MQDYALYCPGEEAMTISLGNTISSACHQKILAMQKWFEANNFPGIKDVIVAYSSLTLLYDSFLIARTNQAEGARAFISKKLKDAYEGSVMEKNEKQVMVDIPVCYEKAYGYDLDEISTITSLPVSEIIHLHSSVTYNVYMVGFLPGFGYMGTVDERIAVARKQKPRNKIEAGSVGIAGIQTGIYPVDSPGGWQIVGRTPLKIFDIHASPPSLLQAGDAVRFHSITASEFQKLAGKSS